jgi:osmotically-inducible protein OsmY
MTKSAALLVLPTRQPGDEPMDSTQAAPLLMQSLEDLRLAERVQRALRGAGYPPLRAIEFTVHAQLVILGGRVPSYYLKQVAQTTALAVQGAHQIRNDLVVGPPG